MTCYKERTVKKGDPNHAYRNYLDMQRQGFMDHEVLDVWSESRMVHQPPI